MVVKEFVQRRVAPLQRHSRPMWTLLSSQDHMRFQESGLLLGTRRSFSNLNLNQTLARQGLVSRWCLQPELGTVGPDGA